MLPESFAQESSEPPRRLEVAVTDREFFVGVGSGVALSPDGLSLATVVGDGSATEVWIRPLDRPKGSRLAVGAGVDAPYQPFFSPDGEWVGYVTPGEFQGDRRSAAALLVERDGVDDHTPVCESAVERQPRGQRTAGSTRSERAQSSSACS
jgi:hypothetical protein